MSAETISRWNAIPMSRPIDDSRPNLKRPRSPDRMDEDDGDDNVSLVSRTPSPQPDNMDVDKYDEYVRRLPEPEAITVDTHIKETNKGFAMLAKLGWNQGQPLGLSGDGRVEPVPFHVKRDLTGLGKINQDVRMIETTVSQRRNLDSERQAQETEEQRRQREDAAARRAALDVEISTTLKAFYCELCDKQFKNVAQYDEHTNSYAHHHKARARDVQASQRARPEEADARKEKERKREEKELRKIAKAAGIKMAKPATAPVSATAPLGEPQNTSALATPSQAGDTEPKTGFKKAGWASVSSTLSAPSSHQPPPPPETGFSRSAWANVGASPTPSAEAPIPSGLAPPPARGGNVYAGLGFRTAGFTSLETGSMTSEPARPPPPPSSGGGWAPAAAPAPPPPVSSGGWTSTPSAAPPPPLQAGGWPATPSGPSQSSKWASPPSAAAPLSSAPAGPPPAAAPPPSLTAPVPPAATPATGRSGWQQFKAKGPKRR